MFDIVHVESEFESYCPHFFCVFLVPVFLASQIFLGFVYPLPFPPNILRFCFPPESGRLQSPTFSSSTLLSSISSAIDITITALASPPIDLAVTAKPTLQIEELGFLMPTEIQRQALPILLSGQDCILHAQTGSGKTLAYFLQIFSVINTQRSALQALIVVPTRELGIFFLLPCHLFPILPLMLLWC
ncbi:ATP-dependent RNA helicase DHH1 [Lactuca sativa]|uniref:ATP-dependent RNA helicase DHH1 n=1 Tax=Lactuca sativa TaxID=4236 RepID=UPI000CD940E9|nr:ATP-dependent RNA helicase DHH1 [Lactuca sativa]